MKKHISFLKLSGIIAAAIIFTLSFPSLPVIAQHENHEQKEHSKEVKEGKKIDSKDYGHDKKMESSKSKKIESNDSDHDKKTESIVRKGKINLKRIDKNKDGKVFQDPMHWNVISDVPGKCPICKMDLKEVTISEARENLVKNGFKVK